MDQEVRFSNLGENVRLDLCLVSGIIIPISNMLTSVFKPAAGSRQDTVAGVVKSVY